MKTDPQDTLICETDLMTS